MSNWCSCVCLYAICSNVWVFLLDLYDVLLFWSEEPFYITFRDGYILLPSNQFVNWFIKLSTSDQSRDGYTWLMNMVCNIFGVLICLQSLYVWMWFCVCIALSFNTKLDVVMILYYSVSSLVQYLKCIMYSHDRFCIWCII